MLIRGFCLEVHHTSHPTTTLRGGCCPLALSSRKILKERSSTLAKYPKDSSRSRSPIKLGWGEPYQCASEDESVLKQLTSKLKTSLARQAGDKTS